MADNTKIEWSDATWNVVTGCDEVSPGCDHCYAKTFAERWRGVPGHHFEQGFDLVLRPERLDLPLRWRKPRRIFVNSMSDLFHKDVPDEFIAKVFATMAAASRHTFQILTKRHARMRALLSSKPFVHEVGRHFGEIVDPRAEDLVRPAGWPFPNVWLGVSVENQQWADIRIPALLDTPAAVRFLSCEPLLGPVHISRWLHDSTCVYDSEFVCTCSEPREVGIDWVIVGGESGPGARPMHPAWARSLRDQCFAERVPFHYKQHGEWTASATPGDRWWHAEPDAWVSECDGRVSDVAGAEAAGGSWMGVYKVGKKAAGRVLDGQTWDEFPEVSP